MGGGNFVDGFSPSLFACPKGVGEGALAEVYHFEGIIWAEGVMGQRLVPVSFHLKD